MEIQIDFKEEIVNFEKQRIKWLMDEFKYQFRNPDVLDSDERERANHYLGYVLESVDISDPEILKFFQRKLDRIEEKFPFLFK